MSRLNVLRVSGYSDYRESYAAQKKLVSLRRNGELADTLVLLEHKPTITMGRRAQESHLLADRTRLEENFDLVESDRGGEVTYHGPGQLVGYFICDLGPRGRQVKRFIDTMLSAISDTLDSMNIEAEFDPQHVGLWTKRGKITAVGIALSHGVSFHGFGLNVTTDLTAYNHIIPCGLENSSQARVADFPGNEGATVDSVALKIIQSWKAHFQYQHIKDWNLSPEQWYQLSFLTT